MSRFIDADTLIEKMLREQCHYYYTNDDIEFGYHNCIRLVYEAPAVDAELIRHGHWIDNGKYWYVCSVCDYVEPLSDLMDAHYKYCPNCGAKMDEVEE